MISLEWDPPIVPADGYKIYVGTKSGTYTQKFDVGPATTFTYTDAVAGQRYCFAVTAYVSHANESKTSAEVCGYSNWPPALTHPGNQSSTVGQWTTLQLTAIDADGQAVTYSATGLPPGLSLGESTGFISGSGTTAGSYSVRVTASDGVLSSSPQTFTWAMDASATPPTAPPTQPQPGSTTPPPPTSSVTLTAQVFNRQTTDEVRLSWTAASWTQTWIYRNGTQIAQTTNSGGFNDSIRRARGAYTYQVCAPDKTVCSNFMIVNF